VALGVAIVAILAVAAIVASSGSRGGSHVLPPAVTAGLSVGHVLDLGTQPGAVVSDPAGSVWISEPEKGVVARVDPTTGRVEELHVGGAPKLLAAVAGG
jgi:streptogramin lyase